jgi:hypothetical protein
MRRLLLPLDVGTELWVDPHTRLDFAAREALAHRVGEDADASRLGYFMNRTLLQDACSQLVVSRRSSYDWAMPSTLPKSGPTITASEPSLRGPAAGTGFRQYASGPSLLDGHFAFWNLPSRVRG